MVVGGREVHDGLKKGENKKKKGIRLMKRMKTTRQTLSPENGATEIYIELRGLNTGSKRISHTVTGPEALRSQCRFS